MINFKDISYLKEGNTKQKKAFITLTDLKIFEILRPFTPVLTGTIPIKIDIDNSDLDIICFCKDLNEFKKILIKSFGKQNNFEILNKIIRNHKTIIVRFTSKNFIIEIFGQDRPINQQEAYLHMLIEYKILQEKGESFRKQIIKLKKQAYKTEPAFAKLLGIKGDPYLELLNY